MLSPKVFVFAGVDRNRDSRLLEEAGCQLVIGDASWMTPQGNNEDEMCLMAQNADALIGTSIRSSPINRRVMLSSETLRIVAKYTIGVDDVDIEAATDLGILVTNSPVESNWGAVAEGTIGLILALLKKPRERDMLVRTGQWRDESAAGTYLGARASDGYPGITLGIVGLGRIGGRIANLLRPWNMRILAYDPYVAESRFAEHGVESTDLSTLLRESDVVSLHVILTPETRQMISVEQLTLMKPTAVLINTSRGPVVDEIALAAALRQETIRAAALDVFEEEPLPEASRQRLADLGGKVLLSPHMVASNAGSGMGLGTTMATEAVLKALRGQVPDNVFNKEAIPQWLTRFENKPLL
jgi:D-3-phosphoglycerate dehydrogenase